MAFILCFVLLSDERVRKKVTMKMFTQTQKWKKKKKKLKHETHLNVWSCCIYRKMIYLMKEQGRKLQWKCLHKHENEKKNLNREHTEICGVVGYIERWFIWWKSKEESYGENVYTNKKINLKVVSATFLLVCFVNLKKGTCEARKNAVYFTSI